MSHAMSHPHARLNGMVRSIVNSRWGRLAWDIGAGQRRDHQY